MQHVIEIAEITLQFNVMFSSHQDPVVVPFHQHLTRSRRTSLQVARRNGEELKRTVQIREAISLNVVKAGLRVCLHISFSSFPDSSIPIKDAGASLDANYVLAAEQELIP